MISVCSSIRVPGVWGARVVALRKISGFCHTRVLDINLCSILNSRVHTILFTSQPPSTPLNPAPDRCSLAGELDKPWRRHSPPCPTDQHLPQEVATTWTSTATTTTRLTLRRRRMITSRLTTAATTPIMTNSLTNLRTGPLQHSAVPTGTARSLNISRTIRNIINSASITRNPQEEAAPGMMTAGPVNVARLRGSTTTTVVAVRPRAATLMTRVIIVDLLPHTPRFPAPRQTR